MLEHQVLLSWQTGVLVNGEIRVTSSLLYDFYHNMDEKTIKERITALEGQRAQMISNVHAIEGAIQDCKYWLEKIFTPKTNDNVMKLTKDKK
jgi:hypothetical protein